MTVRQVADHMQVHPETVRRWLRDGALRGLNLGGVAGWRIQQAELERFIDEREKPASS
ncbi:MAG: DNA-binding protein [Chloroflexi bacterium]|nr:MAG: DNA-binding protein [Chloroflexota bacterium]